MERRELAPWQRTFDIVVVGAPAAGEAQGPGLAPVERLAKTFGMKVGAVLEPHRPQAAEGK